MTYPKRRDGWPKTPWQFFGEKPEISIVFRCQLKGRIHLSMYGYSGESCGHPPDRAWVFLYGQSHFLFSLCPPPPIFTPFYCVRASLSLFYFPLVSIWKMNFLSIRILFFFGNVFPRVPLLSLDAFFWNKKKRLCNVKIFVCGRKQACVEGWITGVLSNFKPCKL